MKHGSNPRERVVEGTRGEWIVALNGFVADDYAARTHPGIEVSERLLSMTGTDSPQSCEH